MRLEDYNLTRCVKCNRLMEKKKGRTLCSRCLAEAEEKNKSTSELSHPLSQSLSIPNSPLTSSTQQTSPISDHTTPTNEHTSSQSNLCAKCKTNPKLPRRELCLSCMTDLYKSLQNASEELAEVKEHNPYEDIVDLQKTISSLRRLEPFRKIRAEGLTWIKRPK